ncbi:MAG TPA: tRNA 2-thiouridine(34) synthase MnmA [Gemmatimonadota bacterium]|nr:tRNA 2-thiouridine(34) synthase MnmA [Gemmatimonadota bacterium]
MRDTWRDIRPGTRVVVAMSGGVDSSVAAALLTERSCNVVGITMKNFCYSEVPEKYASAACCSLEAIEDARAVARRLGIVHHVLDFEAPFREAVIDPFVAEYASGRTPNPCVRCNRFVRFPQLWKKARLLGAERVATGHYARAVRSGGGANGSGDGGRAVELRRPADRTKDQTFYLWGLTRPLLEQALFPLGDLTKQEVRELARGLGLSTAEKPESQDICFIPDRDLRGFLERNRAAHGGRAGPDADGSRGAGEDRFAPGPIVTTAGEILGEHAGSAFYTVGQRRGLGVAARRPLYVTAIEEGNTLVVGEEEELYRSGLEAEEVNWLLDPAKDDPRADQDSFGAQVQIRYRSPSVPATITPGRDPARSGRTATVRFDRPLRAVAPGQSAVFYQDDRVLGGGTIARAIP